MSSRSTQSTKRAFRKTFTYFIPAPPHRRNGYREREFDKIMQGILESGFEIENLQTQATGGDPGGLFIIAVLKAKTKKIFDMDRQLDIQEKFKLSDSHATADIILEEDEDA